MEFLKQYTSQLRAMNGTSDSNGMPSQGDQELKQKEDVNEKTGVMQKITNFLEKRNPYNELMRDTSVVDPVSGQRVNEDFLKLLNNRPDLRKRFDETGSIFSEM
mgnify:CR=1 FL=1